MTNFLDIKLDSFGLDISDSFLRLAKVEKRKGRLFLKEFEEIEISPNIVNNGKIKDEETLKKGLIDIIAKTKIKTEYVITSLPEEKSFFQIIEVKKEEKENLKKIIEYEIENYIPLSLDQVYIDFQLLSSSKNYNNILVVAIPKKIVDLQVNTLKKANLFPVGAEVESTAIARALTDKKDKDKSILFIHIKKEKTILIIFSKNAIRFSTYLLFSINNLVNKIATEKNIDENEAKKIFYEHGLSRRERDDIYNILEPDLTNAVKTIESHLDYYLSCGFISKNAKDMPKIDKIVLSGDGSKIKDINNVFSKKLKSPIEKGDPFKNIFTDYNALNCPNEGFEIAIGLALRNFNLKS